MTTLLEKAIAELAKLPETQQDSMAQWILDELEDETRWNQALAASLSQLEKLGEKALEDYQNGRC